MTEPVKTLLFVATAAVALALAVFTGGGPKLDATPIDAYGELFPKFTDPLAATAVEVIDFDEKSATIAPFRVAQQNGVWTIPSHDFYPADADRQLGVVTSSFYKLEKQGVATTRSSEHALFGVIDPNDSEKVKVGSTGVGKYVKIEGAGGAPVVEVIIGMADEAKPGTRYVRLPKQDAVFRASIDVTRLSTKFKDWIEPDLLKFNPQDLRQLAIDDYSVDALQGMLIPRGRLSLAFDNGQSQWTLKSAQMPEGSKRWKDVALAADEELNAAKLNDAKAAIDELSIIDVAKKPAGLAADLVVGAELGTKEEAARSLQARGFFLADLDGKLQLVSNEGETRLEMSDGVEYLLRFGSVTGNDAANEDGKPADEPKSDAGSTGPSRYIMVSTRFRDDLIPPPDLLPMPPPYEPKKPDEKKTADKKPDEEKKPDDPKASEAKPADKPPEAPQGGGKTDSTDDASQCDPDEKKPDDKKPDEKPPATPVDPEKVKADLERSRVELENENRKKEHAKKVEEGKKRAKELNARFAPWYFVISDATYKRIHLKSADVIQKKAPPADANKPGPNPNVPGLPPLPGLPNFKPKP